METIKESIEVDVPVSTAYNQWTQFEEFPHFMEGIERVQQLDDKHLHFAASIAGRHHEWDAEIVEQVPDQKIAWQSTSGKRNDGAVLFEKIGGQQTRVNVAITFEPEGIEKIGEALGLGSARVKGDLKRFKSFIETRGHESGAWRGEINRGQVNH